MYAQFIGPQYETPAEVRMAGILGADLVGMSTVLEAIAAKAAGLEVPRNVPGDQCRGGYDWEALHHAEVPQAGKDAGERIAGPHRDFGEAMNEILTQAQAWLDEDPDPQTRAELQGGWMPTIATGSALPSLAH